MSPKTKSPEAPLKQVVDKNRRSGRCRMTMPFFDELSHILHCILAKMPHTTRGKGLYTSAAFRSFHLFVKLSTFFMYIVRLLEKAISVTLC